MNIKYVIVIILVQLVFCQVVSAQPRGGGNQTISKLPAKEKRWALIVGVDIFGLKGAVNDARALKNSLVKYAGFPENQVVLLTTDNPQNQPDKKTIIRELDRLSRTVPKDGLFLFSFSGHGKTIDNQAYLIPSDGEMTSNKRLLENFSINVNNIKDAVEEMKVKQVLMLIDSCRDRVEGRGNTGEPLTEAVNRGFSFEETNKDIEAFVTFYATRLGEFAYEYYDKDTNQYRGYFSKALEEALSGDAPNIANAKGEVTLAALIKYVQEIVPLRSYQISGVKQIPLINSNQAYRESELVVSTVNTNAASPTVVANPYIKSDEEAFWQVIENSNEISEFEYYLSKCQSKEFKCIYRATAELKLNRLMNSLKPCSNQIYLQLSAANTGIYKRKEIGVVEANPGYWWNPPSNVKLNYIWNVSGGTIVDGKGTPRIKIDPPDFAQFGGNIEVSLRVDIEDKNAKCSKYSSETIIYKPQISAVKVDEFDVNENICSFATRLDMIVVSLKTDPDSKLLIVNYGNLSSNTIQSDFIKEYLTSDLGIEEFNFELVNKTTPSINSKVIIYLVPPGAISPVY